MTIQKIKIGKFNDIPALNNLSAIPNGANIFLKGENGVGKSSVMQFIEIVLGNTKDIPPNFDANGEITWTNKLGQTYVFSMETKKGKPVITVRSENGMKDTSKGFLWSIVGTPADYNIEEFVAWSETTPGRRKQVDEFKKMLDQETLTLIDGINAQIEVHYKTRTATNQKIEMLKGFMRESKFGEIDPNIQPIDVSALEADIAIATKANATVVKGKSRIAQFEKDNEAAFAKKEELLKLISDIDGQIISNAEKIKDGNEWLKINIEIDTVAMVEQISSASTHNANYAGVQELKAKQEQLAILVEESQDLTVLIDSSKAEVERTVKELSSPVQGLMFTDDGLVYNGVPVSNTTLSTSEIMELGWKMKVAQNPDFDVIFIENSNLIGQKRLEEILQFAKDNDLQVCFEEVVRGQDKLTIEIEGK